MWKASIHFAHFISSSNEGSNPLSLLRALHMVKQFAQHRLLHKLFDRVWYGLTVQQFDIFQTGWNFVAQQADSVTV